MAIRKEAWAERLTRRTPPIKYLTENGFSIIRLCDVDIAAHNSPDDCGFLVEGDGEPEREVHVSFDPGLVADLRFRRRTALADSSVCWLVCAESILALYLWERDDLPRNDHLFISELPPDELMLVLHWRDHD